MPAARAATATQSVTARGRALTQCPSRVNGLRGAPDAAVVERCIDDDLLPGAGAGSYGSATRSTSPGPEKARFP